MSQTSGSREAQRRSTHRALLDASLSLLEERSLGALGLREVTRAAGVSPTAFYRHFGSIEELGIALVEEALESLHSAVRSILATSGDSGDSDDSGDVGVRIDAAVELMSELVRRYPAHLRFIVRERYGGVRRVREVIARQLDAFASEVAESFRHDMPATGWSPDDVQMLARLYVDHMVMTASAYLSASLEANEWAAVTRTARSQLWLIHAGRVNWPAVQRDSAPRIVVP
ncbi:MULTISPECIES: TetR family transcriptional regulator [unclassified Streptomyces]|uniref:TetR family transcriptional regulator n=1 Tax=unclassified Streptomyces TaxID=2593676 RepID=UPI001BE5FEBF|nr:MULTISPECIES: TetR family transcriptional regulator [unclassified Streptomyces]MBT2406610.1 TetR family transcriptional regulator [Streptomyces sp. ISL-21]MBT2458078.1 TetR family transcriptional regulator [Streptomyces sp. ISL-86]MBT2608948.1 TetR family transcriptional regulator [Streptomyces sp. ISL-87]